MNNDELKAVNELDERRQRQIANQTETINRLLAHIQYHCPAFGLPVPEGSQPTLGRCDFVWDGDVQNESEGAVQPVSDAAASVQQANG